MRPLAAAAALALAAAAACSGPAAPAAPQRGGAEWEFTVVPARTPSPAPSPTPEQATEPPAPELSLDPGLELAGRLSQGRWGLTATLLADGSVVVVGGQQRRSFFRSSPSEADVLPPGGDEWVRTDPLAYERTFHTATELPDGRLLVVGGSGREVLVDDDRAFRSRNDLATVEIYDPGDGGWSEASPMRTGRQGARAIMLDDGQVLVVGGASGVSIEEGAEIYDPGPDRWRRAAPMSVPRRFHTATLLPDGRVLVVGGETRQEAHASAEIYDPEADAWTAAAAMAGPRSGHAATLLPDGRVLVVGGSDLGASEGLGPETTAEVHDPADGTWTLVATGLRPRRGHEAVTLADGRVLVAGGEDLVGLPIEAMEVYDPGTGEWEVAGSLPEGRSLLKVVALPDGSALIVGGGTAFGFADFPAHVLRFTVPE